MLSQSMTIISGYCLRKMLVDRIMNMHIFTRTLWDGYSVHFLIWNKYCIHVVQRHAVIHIVHLFSKKFCVVVEKSFETKCDGFEVLSFTITVKYLIWMLHWSCKLKKNGLTLRKVQRILFSQIGFKFLFISYRYTHFP